MPFFADAFDGGQGEAVRVPQAQGTPVKLTVGEDSALMPSLLTLSDVFCTGHHGVTTERVQPGHRWRIEESFQRRQESDRARSAPGPPLDLLAPLDHPGHAHPRLPRRRHRRRRDRSPAPDGLIMLTVNEFRRLFDALLLGTHRTLARLLHWSTWRRRHQHRPRQCHYQRHEPQ